MRDFNQIAIALSRLAFVLASRCAGQTKGASFVETGSAGVGHFVATATLLTNGQVLVAGGGAGPILQNVATAGLDDPATHACSFVGSMSIAKISHSAVLLPNGKVLVAAGSHNDTNIISAELYDPATSRYASLRVA